MSLDNEYKDAATKFKNGGKIAKTSIVDSKVYQEAVAGTVAQLKYEETFNSKTVEKLQALALVKIAEQLGEILALLKEAK